MNKFNEWLKKRIMEDVQDDSNELVANAVSKMVAKNPAKDPSDLLSNTKHKAKIIQNATKKASVTGKDMNVADIANSTKEV